MQTISKRSKQVDQIFANVQTCRAYTLRNNFVGTDCEPRWARTALSTFSFAKLTDRGNGQYTVRVHSNEWYELTTAQA